MKLPKLLGTVTFWLTWPGLWIYLRNSRRTRVIVVSEGQVLLIRPWLGVDEWGLPGGGRHRDESPEEAGIREVMEETGIDIRNCEKRLLFTNKPIREYGFSFTFSCLLVELSDRPALVLQRIEVVDAIWTEDSHLATMRLSKASKECLEAWSDSLDLVH